MGNTNHKTNQMKGLQIIATAAVFSQTIALELDTSQLLWGRTLQDYRIAKEQMNENLMLAAHPGRGVSYRDWLQKYNDCNRGLQMGWVEQDYLDCTALF